MTFQPGDRVRYVPPYAKGDENSSHCETGDVRFVYKDGFVEVMFDGRVGVTSVQGKWLRRWGKAE